MTATILCILIRFFQRLRRLFETPLPSIPGRESKPMLDHENEINDHIYEEYIEQRQRSNCEET